MQERTAPETPLDAAIEDRAAAAALAADLLAAGDESTFRDRLDL
jgi:hypothetical protein